MLHDVINAKYIENYKLKIEFENGYNGIVDFSEYSKKVVYFQSLKI